MTNTDAHPIQIEETWIQRVLFADNESGYRFILMPSESAVGDLPAGIETKAGTMPGVMAEKVLTFIQQNGAVRSLHVEMANIDAYGIPDYAFPENGARMLREQGFHLAEEFDVSAHDRGDSGGDEWWLEVFLPPDAEEQLRAMTAETEALPTVEMVEASRDALIGHMIAREMAVIAAGGEDWEDALAYYMEITHPDMEENERDALVDSKIEAIPGLSSAWKMELARYMRQFYCALPDVELLRYYVNDANAWVDEEDDGGEDDA